MKTVISVYSAMIVIADIAKVTPSILTWLNWNQSL
jgi:hypothetical protein